MKAEAFLTIVLDRGPEAVVVSQSLYLLDLMYHSPPRMKPNRQRAF